MLLLYVTPEPALRTLQKHEGTGFGEKRGTSILSSADGAGRSFTDEQEPEGLQTGTKRTEEASRVLDPIH
ncbi:hypothetical protein ATANTOWER_024028 [Ataeniobius toweri]|uniref:Uncharacterized protein n=1 Tax=Ataeniobius toweri TaxID=208326 RepID=A0ABU7BD57_9TELE|nr:hypothetical protein [Ataeniobius toweri]